MDNQERYEIVEEVPDHYHRTEIPNIIFDLRLDPYEYTLYSVLKSIAGDRGACWLTVNKLSEKCNMGTTKLTECIKKLKENRVELGNKPLIIVKERTKPDGSKDTNLIKIVPIWRNNGDYFRQKYPPKEKESDEGVVPRQTKEGTSPNEGGPSPREPKEDLSKQDLSNKTTNPTLPPVDAIPSTANLVGGLIEKKEENKIYECLKNLDLPEDAKYGFTRRFSEELVSKVVLYTMRPGAAIKNSLETAIGYYLNNPGHMKETKEDREAKKRKEKDAQDELVSTRREYIKALNKELWHQMREIGASIYEPTTYDRIEVKTRDGVDKQKIFYTEKNFRTMIECFLRKIGLTPPQFLYKMP